MAERNQILSMFGAAPEQVRARLYQDQARQVQQMENPYQQVGATIGTAISRMFGGAPNEVQTAEQMQQAMQDVDINDPSALRELANTVSSFAPERALQIVSYANQLEQNQMGEVVEYPMIVGTKPIYKPETNAAGIPTGNYVRVGEEPIIRNVPHVRTPDGLQPFKGMPTEFVQETTPPAETVTPPPSADYIFENGELIPNPAKTTQQPQVQTPPPATQEQTVTPPVESKVVQLQTRLDNLADQINSLPLRSIERRKLVSEFAKLKKELRLAKKNEGK